MHRLLQQQDFKALFDNTLDAIMVADDDGVYLAANEAACQLLKAPESAILGRTVADFTSPERYEKSKIAWQAFLREGHRSGEIELICADGSRCVVDFRAKANFRPGQHLSVMRDITERKRTEAALVESNRQIISIMESVSDTVLAFDREWRFLYANPQSEPILGQPPHQVIGKNLWEEYPQARGTVFEEGYLRAAREKRPVRFRGHQVGVDAWLEAHVYPSDIGVTVYLQDVSERQRAEDGLHFLSEAGAVLSSSLEHDQVIKNLAELTISHFADWCSIDALEDGQIKRLAVVHKDPAKIQIAQDFQRRYPPKLDSSDGVAQVLRTGKPQFWPEISDELLVTVAPDEEWLGTMRALGLRSIIIVPLVAGGQTIGAMTLVREKSGRPYLQSDLVVAQELGRRAGGAVENGKLFRDRTAALRTAEEASRAKDEFLAIVSHELKTPMTPILGWIGILQEEANQRDPEIFHHALDVMERNVKAQAQLVNDLLDISRIVTGKLQLNTRPIDLGAVARLAVETARPAAAAKGVELVIHFDSAIEPIMGDEARLQQVMWNLLSNAIKFTPTSGFIVVSLHNADSFVEFKVRDTGKGLRSEFLPYVFDRFRQADSSSSREHGGLGLGLAIVRNLVELHGGTIQAESPGLGFGATFTVQFPIQTKDSDSNTIILETTTNQPQETPVSTRPLEEMRVLIIEDMDDSREMVAAILTRSGAQVREAACAREGLTLVQQWLPDAILCDIGMPGEDGYSFIERVRALPAEAGGNTAAIALTAYGRMEDRLKALSSGFQNHIVKPASPNELITALADLRESV